MTEITQAEVYQGTNGPWHHGQALSCEVLGAYVTVVVAGDPLVLTAIIEYLTGHSPTQASREVLVGSVADPKPIPRRRITNVD